MQIILWNIEGRQVESGDILGRSSWLQLVDTKLVVRFRVHSGVGTENKIEAEVEVEEEVTGEVGV